MVTPHILKLSNNNIDENKYERQNNEQGEKKSLSFIREIQKKKRKVKNNK